MCISMLKKSVSFTIRCILSGGRGNFAFSLSFYALHEKIPWVLINLCCQRKFLCFGPNRQFAHSTSGSAPLTPIYTHKNTQTNAHYTRYLHALSFKLFIRQFLINNSPASIVVRRKRYIRKEKDIVPMN